MFDITSSEILPPAPGVNPALADYHQALGAFTGLNKVGTKTYSVIGFGGNINFIEAPAGTIVVNTGTTFALTQEAFDLYRAVSDKPVVALIYTHGYADHTGGGPVLVPRERLADVQVYASAAWHGFIEQNVSPLLPEIAMRAAAQVGWLLPPGIEGTVGNALTRPVRGAGGSGYIAPTVDVDKPTRYNIAGIELELIPAPHDLDDGLIVWMPDERILIGGDLLMLYQGLPALATPRNEPRRDPQKWIDSMGLAASYRPAHMINAYGPPVSGEAEIQTRLLGQQRVGQYLVDEINRRLLRGENADVIAATVKLPEAITQGRSFGETYHRLSWIVRSLIAREFGHFSGDVADLVRLPPREEAERFVEALGGDGAVLERATQAYAAGDHRWSLRLAGLLLQASVLATEAQTLRIACLQTLAYASNSANERNYLLTAVVLENGALDRNALMRQIRGAAPSDIVLHKPPVSMLQVLGHKLKVVGSGERPVFSIRFAVTDKDATLDATVLPAVMLRGANPNGSSPDLELRLTHDALIRGIEGMSGWNEMRQAGSIAVSGPQSIFDRFMAAFDW